MAAETSKQGFESYADRDSIKSEQISPNPFSMRAAYDNDVPLTLRAPCVHNARNAEPRNSRMLLQDLKRCGLEAEGIRHWPYFPYCLRVGQHLIQHVLLMAVSFAAERLGQRCFCGQLSSMAMFKVFIHSLVKGDESISADVSGSAAAFGAFR